MVTVQTDRLAGLSDNAAVFSGTMTTAVSSGNAVVTWTELYDTQAAWNAATGVFTAEVAGFYMVMGTFLAGSAGNNQITLQVDDVSGGAGWATSAIVRQQDASNSMVMQKIVYLDVGDMVRFLLSAGSIASGAATSNFAAIFPLG